MPDHKPVDIAEYLRYRAAGLGGRRLALIVVGVLLLMFIGTTWFTVRPEETGIVQRFGAVERTVRLHGIRSSWAF